MNYAIGMMASQIGNGVPGFVIGYHRSTSVTSSSDVHLIDQLTDLLLLTLLFNHQRLVLFG
jgi:hypothetical protein